MSNPIAQHQTLLKQHQFRLIRQDKHLVYQNPDGKVYVAPATPSDHRWAKNAISVLKRIVEQPAKPIIIAISEFEREQAAAVIQAQSKDPGPGHTKQKSNGGTGFTYIDKVQKEIVSTLTPEQKLAEKAKNQWEASVRSARQEFIDLIVSKAKPLIIKSDEDYERRRQEVVARYKYYANTRLRRDIEFLHPIEEGAEGKNHFKVCPRCIAFYAMSPLFRHIDEIDHSYHDDDDELAEHAKACSICVTKEETENGTIIIPCVEEQYKRYRKIALNIDRFLSKEHRATKDTAAKDMKHAFQEAMKFGDKYFQDWDEGTSIYFRNSEEVLWRFALQKLKPIVKELLKQRPNPMMEAVA